MDKGHLEIQYSNWLISREVLNIPMVRKFLDVYDFLLITRVTH